MATMQDVGSVPEWTLGDRLRKAREQTGLDGRSFADAIGISGTALYNAEAGKSRPREITLRAWAMRTGVPLMWLKTGAAPSPDDDGAHVPPDGIEPSTYSLQGDHFAEVIPLRLAS